ncbi:cytokinin riboside 5'-monophosphate phosphoribohydrolase LOG1-like protein [Tanacetum coccineum]
MEGEGTSSKEVETSKKLKRICVFCGSRTGLRSSFTDAALELGQEMVKRKIGLVYGGGSVGLMGLISQTVFNGGGHVLGVIPKALVTNEISGETVGELRIVSGMHQRKAIMFENADAFIALPEPSSLPMGLDQVGLLNVDGFYNSLLTFFDKGVDEGFIEVAERKIMVSAVTVQDLLTKIEEYVTVHESVVPKQNWEMD